jgi:hypothetical protein
MKFEGIDELDKILRDIPKEVAKKGHVAAARKAAKPIRDGARQILSQEAKGTDGGFSKLELLAQYVVVQVYKGIVNIQVRKPPDTIPLQLRGREGFGTYGYARLMAKGRQWTAKSTNERRSHWTGRTQGIGDFVESSFESNFYKAGQIYKGIRAKEILRAINRAKKKYVR